MLSRLLFVISLIGVGVISGCSNATVTVGNLKKWFGSSSQSTPGYDAGNPVATGGTGTFTVRAKVDSQSTRFVTNGSFTVTAEVVR